MVLILGDKVVSTSKLHERYLTMIVRVFLTAPFCTFPEPK